VAPRRRSAKRDLCSSGALQSERVDFSQLPVWKAEQFPTRSTSDEAPKSRIARRTTVPQHKKARRTPLLPFVGDSGTAGHLRMLQRVRRVHEGHGLRLWANLWVGQSLRTRRCAHSDRRRRRRRKSWVFVPPRGNGLRCLSHTNQPAMRRSLPMRNSPNNVGIIGLLLRIFVRNGC
jgi:hypothetical protein